MRPWMLSVCFLVTWACAPSVEAQDPCPQGGVEVVEPPMCVYATSVVQANGFLCPDDVPVLVRYGEVSACRESDEATTQATDAVRAAAQDGGLGQVSTQDRWKNPFFGDPRRAEAGRAVFQSRCSGCHGADASENPLKVPEGNLEVALMEGLPDQEVLDVVRGGRLSMPSFAEGVLSDIELWEIITFLRSTQ